MNESRKRGNFSAIRSASSKHLIEGPVEYWRNDRFFYTFIHLKVWNPKPFVNLKPENGIPIRGDPSKIVHYSKYPRRLGFDYLDLVTVSYHGYQMCQIWWVEKRRCGTSRISIKAGINNDRRLEWCETHEK